MGGFVGLTGIDSGRLAADLARMLDAPTVVGPRHSGSSAIRSFGKRDASYTEDDAGALAIAGFVRLDDRALTAAELLAKWRARGEHLLPRLRGEFAIAIATADDVTLVRDQLGARPLYVGDLLGGRYAFGTSIAPLVYAGVSTALDHDALVRSLVLGYPTAPATVLARVRQLGPGEIVTLGSARGARRWYRPGERIEKSRSFAEAAEVVDRALTRAVARALPDDGRAGAFLSGGLDSAIVLARLHEAGRATGAYTLFFGDAHPSEIRYARAVADHLGVPHHVLEVDGRRFRDGVEPAATHLEDVLSEAIAVPNFLLARTAARDVDVLFTGEGGDQGFGGPKNVSMVMARTYAGHPASPSLGETYAHVHQYLSNDLDDALCPDVRAAFDPERLTADIVTPFFEGRDPRKSFVGRVMVGNTVIKGGNNILPKVAKTIGAANDLSLRSPMFDPDLIAAAFTVPPSQKLWGATQEKLVLRQAARRSLPAAVVDRPKRGMSLPLRAWMSAELGEMARDVLTERAVRERGIFRWSYVERLLGGEPCRRDHARSRATDKLWLLLVTEIHMRALDALAVAARAPGARRVA